jgi:hypothetical protein
MLKSYQPKKKTLYTVAKLRNAMIYQELKLSTSIDEYIKSGIYH